MIMKHKYIFLVFFNMFTQDRQNVRDPFHMSNENSQQQITINNTAQDEQQETAKSETWQIIEENNQEIIIQDNKDNIRKILLQKN